MALIAAILSSRIPGCSALAAVLCVVPSSSYLVPTSFKRPRGSIQFDTSTLGSADTRSQDVTNSVSRRSRLRILLAPGGTEGCCACMKFGQQMPVRPHSASLIATSRCLLHRCTAAADGVACTGAVLALSSVVVWQVVSSVKAETCLLPFEPQVDIKGQQGPFAAYIAPLNELQLFFAASVDHSAFTVCYHESLPR